MNPDISLELSLWHNKSWNYRFDFYETWSLYFDIIAKLVYWFLGLDLGVWPKNIFPSFRILENHFSILLLFVGRYSSSDSSLHISIEKGRSLSALLYPGSTANEEVQIYIKAILLPSSGAQQFSCTTRPVQVKYSNG